MLKTALFSVILSSVSAQFGFFPQPQQQPQWGGGFWNQQNRFQQPFQIQPQNQQFNPFGQIFQPFTLAPPTTTTTLENILNVPNPDLEVGNFPVPNPGNWPTGPDWNDPRNTWVSEDGWGGRRKATTTTEAPEFNDDAAVEAAPVQTALPAAPAAPTSRSPRPTLITAAASHASVAPTPAPLAVINASPASLQLLPRGPAKRRRNSKRNQSRRKGISKIPKKATPLPPLAHKRKL